MPGVAHADKGDLLVGVLCTGPVIFLDHYYNAIICISNGFN